MKFSIAVAISALAASVSAGALPARFVLTEGDYTFLTANSHAYSRINVNRNPPLIRSFPLSRLQSLRRILTNP